MVLIAFVAAILALVTGAWLYRTAISVFTPTQSADEIVALLIISFLAQGSEEPGAPTHTGS